MEDNSDQFSSIMMIFLSKPPKSLIGKITIKIKLYSLPVSFHRYNELAFKNDEH